MSNPEYLDKSGLDRLVSNTKDYVGVKVNKKIDKPVNVLPGKVLQTDSHGDPIWGEAVPQADITQAVEDWLEENIDPGSAVTLDPTLTQQQAAAQAKATGDAIDNVKDNLIIVDDTEPLSEDNKIWFPESVEEEVTVPTIDDFNNLVKVQDTQPSEEVNKIWIRETPQSEVMIPTDSEVDSIIESIAPNYEDLIYPIAVGTLCTHDRCLYVSTVEIPSIEEWNSTHWSTDNVANIVKNTVNAIKQNYDDLADDVNSLSSAIAHVGVIAKASDFTVLGFIESNTGNVSTAGTNWRCTDFMPLNGAKHFYATVGTLQYSGTTAGLAFYNSEKTYQSGVICRLTGTAGFEVRDIPVPTGAEYVRLCFRQVELGYFFAVGNNSYAFDDDLLSVSNYVSVVASKADFAFTGFIEPHTGNVNTGSTSWAYTDYIDITGINKFVATVPTMASSGVLAGLAFYKNDKTYNSGVAARVTGVAGYEERIIAVPNDTVYVRISFRKTDIEHFYAVGDRFFALSKKESSSSTFGIQMFEKIGVIGDSISVGWAKNKSGNNSRRNTGISWVQQMARRTGCIAYNLGASGVDPIEWFQENYEFYEYCLPQYQSVGKCDLYIIGLGLNGETLGTINDINQSDYTQNASTFYGQYARIIQMINAEHPESTVICLTEPTTAISSYDQAVRDICALNYINAELLDLEHDYFELFNTPEITAEHQPDGLHFTPYGYSLIADAMTQAINDYIAKNPTHFKYVGVQNT